MQKMLPLGSIFLCFLAELEQTLSWSLKQSHLCYDSGLLLNTILIGQNKKPYHIWRQANAAMFWS